MPDEPVKLPVARWTDAPDAEGPVLAISGDWRVAGPRPTIEGHDPQVPPARFDASGLIGFDSTLPAFLLSLLRRGDDPEASPDAMESLPDNLQGLMQLAISVPEQEEIAEPQHQDRKIRQLGNTAIGVWTAFLALAEFLGQTLLSLGRLATGRARLRMRDFFLLLQQCGADALPIVSLICFLIGMIMAFVGNVQLANFGASLYVADLVAIAMVRELGVVMTAIIISGRTGAAFAAQLGSMNANQEIDALRGFGFDPFDFLVLPRVLALVLMMPLLTIYANLLGILGGMVVAAGVGIPPALYWYETLDSINLVNSSLGVIKSVFFGMVIAITGCMQGMGSGGSSAAVGRATTRAVVISITAIIVLDSAFAAIFTVLDI